MDVDHLYKLIVAVRDEEDDGPAWDAFVAYLDEQRHDRAARLSAILDNVEQRCRESAILDMQLLGELVRHQRQRA